MPRFLPLRASVEWLRKTAKQRLETLRAAEPDAQLSDAQLAVAREYGHPSWRALVAHVEQVREKLREWQRMPVDAYQELRERDGGAHLTDFTPLFVHLAVIGISDFFHSGEEVVKMLVPEGTDLAELEREYEAFIPRLLLDGLRKR